MDGKTYAMVANPTIEDAGTARIPVCLSDGMGVTGSPENRVLDVSSHPSFLINNHK